MAMRDVMGRSSSSSAQPAGPSGLPGDDGRDSASSPLPTAPIPTLSWPPEPSGLYMGKITRQCLLDLLVENVNNW